MFGPRQIQRLPFEVMPVPRYDGDDARHVELAGLSRAGHAHIAPHAAHITGNTANARKQARAIVQSTLDKIDVLTCQLFALPAPVVAAGGTGSLFDGVSSDGK